MIMIKLWQSEILIDSFGNYYDYYIIINANSNRNLSTVILSVT